MSQRSVAIHARPANPLRAAQRGLLVAMALLLCLGFALPVAPAAHGSQPDDETALQVVRALTNKYHDVEVAVADGFVEHPPCIPMMGIHFLREDRFDDRIEQGRPELLLYRKDVTGVYHLVGAEWALVDADQNLATDDDRPSLFGHDFDGPMLGHEPGQPIHYDLHAYAWVDNPLGPFRNFNPNVVCA